MRDIFIEAKNNGQKVLVDLPYVPFTKRSSYIRKTQIIRDRQLGVDKLDNFYNYAKENPNLCPPVGSTIKYITPYGLKVKVVVILVGGGLPGTLTTLLPDAEQPEWAIVDIELHKKKAGIREGWVCWPDEGFWRDWQDKIKKEGE